MRHDDYEGTILALQRAVRATETATARALRFVSSGHGDPVDVDCINDQVMAIDEPIHALYPTLAAILDEGIVPSRPTRQCAHCSNDYTPNRADSRYCATRCRVAAHRARSRPASRSADEIVAELADITRALQAGEITAAQAKVKTKAINAETAVVEAALRSARVGRRLSK